MAPRKKPVIKPDAEPEVIPEVPLIEKWYDKARNWVIANRNEGNLSNWITVSDTGGTFQRTCEPCHYGMTHIVRLKGTPVVHAEKFCRWDGLGEAGQRYFKWLCTSESSLFAPWFGEEGVELVRYEDKIAGALWKNVDAPDRIVTQWILGARCAGEHQRAHVWDSLVQSGFNPRFAFWAMHFFSESRGVFQKNGTGHVGIDFEVTLDRIMRRHPRFDMAEIEAGPNSKRNPPKPFKEKDGNMMYSNHIWFEPDPMAEYSRVKYSPLFPLREQKSSSFGGIKVHGFDLISMQNGAKAIEDKLKVPMFGDN